MDALLAQSREFEELWSAHEIGITHSDLKRNSTPRSGVLAVLELGTAATIARARIERTAGRVDQATMAEVDQWLRDFTDL